MKKRSKIISAVTATAVAITALAWSATANEPEVYEVKPGALLGAATHFHLFAEEVTLQSHVHGNVATNMFNASGDFGVRPHNLDGLASINYIKDFSSKPLNEQTLSTKLVLGNDVEISDFDNGNGYRITAPSGGYASLRKQTIGELVIEDKDTPYIDIKAELSKFSQMSEIIASMDNTDGVTASIQMNGSTIDCSNANKKFIYYNIDLKSDAAYNSFAGAATPLDIKGLNFDEDDTLYLTIDVGDRKSVEFGKAWIAYNPQGEKYKTGEIPLSKGGGRIIYNIVSNGKPYEGKIFLAEAKHGSFLVPKASIWVGSNTCGTVIARSITCVGESHRWDVQVEGKYDKMDRNPILDSWIDDEPVVTTTVATTTKATITTPKPTTTTKATTTVKPTTTSKTTTTKVTTTTEITTPEVTTTPEITTTTETTTPKVTTSKKTTTSEKITTTPKVTTSKKTTTSEKITTTPKVTTSKKTTTSEKATTTPKVTTSKKTTTSEKATTTPKVTTSKKTTTSEKATTTPKVTTSKKTTTSEKITTTPKVTTSKKTTTSEKATTTPKVTTSKKTTTSEKATTTPKVTTSKKTTTSEKTTTTPEGTTTTIATTVAETTTPEATTTTTTNDGDEDVVTTTTSNSGGIVDEVTTTTTTNGTSGSGSDDNGTSGSDSDDNGTDGSDSDDNGTSGSSSGDNGTSGSDSDDNGTSGSGSDGNGTNGSSSDNNGTSGSDTGSNSTGGNNTGSNSTDVKPDVPDEDAETPDDFREVLGEKYDDFDESDDDDAPNTGLKAGVTIAISAGVILILAAIVGRKKLEDE